jgi:hypothetical protein
MAEITTFISTLNSCKQQSIFWHNQTISYAEHKALQDYYDAIGDIVDGIVESTQGKYGILTGWKSFPTEEYQSTEQCITYLKTLSEETLKAYNIVKDTYIQNQLDEVTTLINSTLYKLRFLK